MASINIEKRNGKQGVSFRARVRVTKKGKIIEEETESFKTRLKAEAWANRVKKRLEQKQHEISQGVYFDPETNNELEIVEIGELIRRYLEDPLTGNSVGRTKSYVLRSLMNHDISHKLTNQLTAKDLIEHCKTRLKGEVNHTGKLIIPSPQTIYHDVSYLHSVMKVAPNTLNIKTDTRYHDAAIPTLIDLKLIGKSKKRSRRPNSEELTKLEQGLKEREQHKASHIPFSDILQFSILTCMRVGEITDLLWEDLDKENKTITVRDRKDPRSKEGNDGEVPLLGEAFDIVLRQSGKDKKRIFPYNPKSITAGWQRVRAKLGIKDLRYHDLRREGASRLAEQGYPITTVAKITGHKNINILYDIYTAVDIKKLARESYEQQQGHR
ncbi:site-specific integrase [uncultured Ferrimonas sp.]|uniref:site-specific integrase n=1 Tax=uncultured Ferrimonas sp. TaxID=432640 RepID=UPI00260DFF38|nr:site-specific integrase [uncultured Ferrimonas sp.]